MPIVLITAKKSYPYYWNFKTNRFFLNELSVLIRTDYLKFIRVNIRNVFWTRSELSVYERSRLFSVSESGSSHSAGFIILQLHNYISFARLGALFQDFHSVRLDPFVYLFIYTFCV